MFLNPTNADDEGAPKALFEPHMSIEKAENLVGRDKGFMRGVFGVSRNRKRAWVTCRKPDGVSFQVGLETFGFEKKGPKKPADSLRFFAFFSRLLGVL